jgi:transposase
MTVIIGVDPHKSTHTTVAIDREERPLARVRLVADRCQVQRLLAWAEPLGTQRSWAVESAGGLGKLLAQQLVEAGELVVDVPPTLAARVRLLGSTKASKNDPNDALATAIAGLRHCGLRGVRLEDHTAVIRMVIDRYDDLVALRTQATCRLHVALRELIAGGAPRHLGASRAAKLLRSIHPQGAAGVERKRLALELLADVGRLAGFILGHVADPARFPTPERFASDNGTAPIQASSGPRTRHRLNPRGNRKLNHALHLAALTQVRHDTPGRVYYQRKMAEGNSKKEALRALKRQTSDAVGRQLQVDLGRRQQHRPGRTIRDDSSIQHDRLNPEHRHFGASHSRTRTPRYARAHGAASTRPHTPS